MLARDTLLQNRYRVVRLLAEGGMGAVYEAVDERLGNVVALKKTFFSDEQMRNAFEREARLLARLRHAALPVVSDHFTEDDGQFLIMQFIPGDDLEEMLTRRGEPFPVEEVLGWADQLLDALDYLHAQQPPIIHRDIKPQNLKLTERGQIVLLDFGLAKGDASQSARLTSAKSIFGYTPHYAPIEQIQGSGTDHRSDLYSLAATLYHLMTGVIPPGALLRLSAVAGNDPDPMQRGQRPQPEDQPGRLARVEVGHRDQKRPPPGERAGDAQGAQRCGPFKHRSGQERSKDRRFAADPTGRARDKAHGSAAVRPSTRCASQPAAPSAFQAHVSLMRSRLIRAGRRTLTSPPTQPPWPSQPQPPHPQPPQQAWRPPSNPQASHPSWPPPSYPPQPAAAIPAARSKEIQRGGVGHRHHRHNHRRRRHRRSLF